MFWTQTPSLLRSLDWQGRLDPFRELNRIQSEVDRLFAPLSRALVEPQFPPVRVLTSEEGALLIAPIPGVEPKDIDITVSGDTLTLKGERALTKPGQDGTWHRNERRAGRFARTIALPFDVDAEQVQASFHDGVLEVRLPRVASQKPRKIQIATS